MSIVEKFGKTVSILLGNPVENKPEHKSECLIPWVQEIRKPKGRLTYDGVEWEAIQKLRDRELENPAPFSSKTLVEYHNHASLGYESPVDFSRYRGSISSYRGNVPVMQIIGACTTNNMHEYEKGMTYGEVLFDALHGAGLKLDALEFLASEAPKSEEMPHTIINHDRKTRSGGELKLTRFGDYYFSSHGHQRTILAMFHVWQEEGIPGMLKNVHVTEWHPTVSYS